MKSVFIIFVAVALTLPSYSNTTNSDNVKYYKVIAELLQNGINEALNNNMKECYQYFDEAYAMAETQKLEQLLPILAISHSRLLFIEEKYSDAFIKIEKVSHLIAKQPSTTFAGDYYEILAQCYLEQEKWDLALLNLQKAEEIRIKVEPGKNWRTYNGMAKAYRSIGKDDLADEYSIKASKLSKIQNARRIILDIQNELKFDEQSGTIASLSMQNIKAKAELQKAKFRNILLLTLLVAFVIISILLFYILKQRTLYNKEMAIKNELISKSLGEKEALVQEVHHRVKNNLQIISSLLSLHSRSVHDKITTEALLESQSRVMTMSLIHQNLYKNGPSSRLEVKEYLNNLCRQIFDTYNILGSKIKIHTDIQYGMVDVNLLVPLGLIVNELITNALKYAFEGRDAGFINITLGSVNEIMKLTVKDDGNGYNMEQNEGGFGHKLIDVFARKLEAEVIKKVDHGTSITLIFKHHYFE